MIPSNANTEIAVLTEDFDVGDLGQAYFLNTNKSPIFTEGRSFRDTTKQNEFFLDAVLPALFGKVVRPNSQST